MASGLNTGTVDTEMDFGSFFDNIDDFLDVPNDDVGEASSLLPIDDLHSFPPASSFPCSDSVFSNSDISTELSVPYEDIVQLEWLSSFVEDSFSGSGGGLTVNQPSPGKLFSDHRFRTSSPISVLDSSSSCSADKTSATLAPNRCGRARSKRPRPTTNNFWPITVLPPPPVAAEAYAGSENSAESRLVIKKKKNKKIKFTLPAAAAPADGNHVQPSHQVRKCLHCEITKTPQWRAGPMGLKTLCNACGVRYKSGRLFPEYRPAASPTFVPTVHSNSHKKVLEMRNETGGRPAEGVIGGGGGGGSMAVIEVIPNALFAMDSRA